jgi:hypothetical protein
MNKSDLKMSIMSKVRFQYMISDPFPEYTQHQMSSNMFKKRWWQKAQPNPHQISIHAAYRLGEFSVYSRLESALDLIDSLE